jgi:hypothetical protein
MKMTQHTPEDEMVTLQWCDACGSEGYELRSVMVYEHGCGFAHPDTEIDYSRPCKCCEGTGLALIECEPCEGIEDAYQRSGEEYHV